ncbi:MAG: AAA family ATPase [Candidatus Promineifilaceae bacterium]|nr:AAA family ATPase [Candidatus Promineifilaceae bacterium]
MLYETLTGERPFRYATPAKLLYSHLNEPLPLVAASRPDISTEFDEVLQRATAKAPAERFATVGELAHAFCSLARGVPPARDGRSQASIPALVDVHNPYKGLHAFQEADADDFFGREALVQQLVDRLAAADGQATRFLAVVGPSGSGKSSVVKAGLIPALRDGALPGAEKWFITEMVPGSHPLAELETALWRVAVDPPPDLVTPMRRDEGGMLRTIRRVLPQETALQRGGPQLLLLIDQFEELFTLVEDAEEREFFLESILMALNAPRSPLRLVITLRADFYDRPLQHPQWGRLLKQQAELVLPLNRTELTWAVREPAARMGVHLEDQLAGDIVADVADQPGGLPLLQYVMTELFERRQDHRITRAAYEELGGVQGALGRRAEAVYNELDDQAQTLTRQLFLRLVTLGQGVEDTRRRVKRAELEALSATGSAGVRPGAAFFC